MSREKYVRAMKLATDFDRDALFYVFREALRNGDAAAFFMLGEAIYDRSREMARREHLAWDEYVSWMEILGALNHHALSEGSELAATWAFTPIVTSGLVDFHVESDAFGPEMVYDIMAFGPVNLIGDVKRMPSGYLEGRVPLGLIQLTHYDGRIIVKWVNVDDSMRRTGLSAALYLRAAQELGVSYDDLESTLTTDEGARLRDRLDVLMGGRY